MRNNPIYVDVVAYPSSDSLVKSTINALEGLNKRIYSNYGIDCPIGFTSLLDRSSVWCSLVKRVIDASASTKGFVSSEYLQILLQAASLPGEEPLFFVNKKDEFLDSYVIEVTERSAEFQPVPKALFVAVEANLPLSVGKYMWGECAGTYPMAVAVEVTGQSESLFHECLHIFGVKEGYDCKTKRTKPECSSNCWMQYSAIDGTGLCNGHLLELRNFLKNLEA